MTYAGVEDGVEWLAAPNPSGIRIGRKGPQVVVDWPGVGRASSVSSGDIVEFTPLATAAAETLEKFRVTGLLACRRYLSGKLSLHASAVAFPFGCIALVGECGAGKSTTAMALVEQHGGTFLADDIVPVDWDRDKPIVFPVKDSFWLNPDASAWFGVEATARSKRPCSPRTRSVAPEKLRAVVHLVFDEVIGGAELTPVTGADAFAVLSKAHVCYSAGDDDDSVRNFEARAKLAGSTTVLRLARRRRLETLGQAAHLLEEHLSR